jgi:hypothetical protein
MVVMGEVNEPEDGLPLFLNNLIYHDPIQHPSSVQATIPVHAWSGGFFLNV